MAVVVWRNIRTGETFLAPNGGWTSENPDWTDGFQRMPNDPILESQQGVTAAIAPPVEPEGPDICVAPETIIVCAPVVPELVEVEEPVDILIGPWGWVPPIPPTIIEKADGLIIIGGPIQSVLEGGDGNDLIIAGASADHPGNWYATGWGGSPPYYLRGDSLLGGLGQDTLIGNNLSNDLDGGAGADVMIGGGGEDIYWVNNAGDMVIETAHGGADVVISSVSYTLSENVERLTLSRGAGDINAIGNELDNSLFGNDGSNFLSGGAGDDRLYAMGGGDTLVGGAGADVFGFVRTPLELSDVYPEPENAESIIWDFEVNVDRIMIGQNWANRSPLIRQEGSDAIITLVNRDYGLPQEIRLIGIDASSLGADDFIGFYFG
jgi:hypothetical protein